jgi:hypothetical protein
MPSAITGIIGGIQGSSAAHNAANAVAQGNAQAGQTVADASKNANTGIANAGTAAQTGVTNAATTAGTTAVSAGQTAGAGVTASAGTANGLLNPYISAGSTAAGQLSDLANQKFTFSPDDPSYQWRLQQGQQALERSAAARGAVQGGGVMKALTNYAQGAASQEYQAAFDRFNTTRQTSAGMLSNLAGMGLNASTTAGVNDINAAKYAGDAGMQTTEYAGNAGMTGAKYAGDYGMASADEQSRNTMNAGIYQGNMQAGSGQAKAAGDMGAANAWNGMLNGIGSAANSALLGGFGGGGNFSWQGAAAGVPPGWVPRGWTTTPASGRP